MSKIKTILFVFALFCACLLRAQDGKKDAAPEKDVTIKANNIVVVAPDSKTFKQIAENIGAKKEEEKQAPVDSQTVGRMLGDFFKTWDFSLLKKRLLAKLNAERIAEGLNVWKFIFLFVGIFISLAIARFSRWFIEHFIAKKFAQKTKSDVDDLLCEALSPPVWLFLISGGFFISALPVINTLDENIHHWANRIALALCASAIAWGVYRLISILDFFMGKLVASSESNVDDLIASLVRKSLKITVAIVSVLFIGQNILGLNITTLLAGAGVAGLAIAFAAQDTIGNFFGSIMIILDKPFKVGDRIKAAGADGSVEHVGFRSTRVRTLDGHLITVPNKELANQTVENVTKRPYIKFVSNLTLVYDTPVEKMERAIEILHEIYDDHEGMDAEMPPRIYFNSFNDWSLNILVIAWYHPGDYFMSQEWNHKRNLEILRRFNAEGLEFAFPTNTTYLAYDKKRKVEFNIEQK
jgi:MscS family membrane protein